MWSFESISSIRSSIEEAGDVRLSCLGVSGLRMLFMLVSLGIGGAIFSKCANFLITALMLCGNISDLIVWRIVVCSSFATFAVLFGMLAGPAVGGVRGGGVPEIRALYSGGLRAADGGVLSHPFLSTRALACKLASFSFAVAAGLPIGTEGPIIHVCCCWGSALMRTSSFRRIGERRELRGQILLASVVVGVVATWATPIAGALFAVEVVSVAFMSSGWWKLFFVAIWTVVARHLLTHLGHIVFHTLVGNNSFALFYPLASEKPSYAVNGLDEITFPVVRFDVMLIAAIIGCLGGIAGSAFVKINAASRNFLWGGTDSNARQLTTAAIIAALVLVWPSVAGEAMIAFSRLVYGRSDRNQAMALRTALACSSDCALRRLLASRLDGYANLDGWLKVGVHVVLGLREFLLAPVALSLPLSAGCVKPLLVLGSFVGIITKGLLVSFFSWSAASSLPLSVYAFIGATSTCASVTAMASAVAVVETTNALRSVSLPAFAAALAGRAIARKLVRHGGTFYDVQAVRKHYRELPRFAYDALSCAEVRDACTEDYKMRASFVIPPLVKPEQLRRALDDTPDDVSYLPVVRDYRHPSRERFLGAISCEDVNDILLQTKVSKTYVPTKLIDLDEAGFIANVTVFTFNENVPCSDLIPHLQRDDFAFVVTDSNKFFGVVTRESFIQFATSTKETILYP